MLLLICSAAASNAWDPFEPGECLNAGKTWISSAHKFEVVILQLKQLRQW